MNCKICMRELCISCFKKVVSFKHVLNGSSALTVSGNTYSMENLRREEARLTFSCHKFSVDSDLSSASDWDLPPTSDWSVQVLSDWRGLYIAVNGPLWRCQYS